MRYYQVFLISTLLLLLPTLSRTGISDAASQADRKAKEPVKQKPTTTPIPAEDINTEYDVDNEEDYTSETTEDDYPVTTSTLATLTSLATSSRRANESLKRGLIPLQTSTLPTTTTTEKKLEEEPMIDEGTTTSSRDSFGDVTLTIDEDQPTKVSSGMTGLNLRGTGRNNNNDDLEGSGIGPTGAGRTLMTAGGTDPDAEEEDVTDSDPMLEGSGMTPRPIAPDGASWRGTDDAFGTRGSGVSRMEVPEGSGATTHEWNIVDVTRSPGSQVPTERPAVVLTPPSNDIVFSTPELPDDDVQKEIAIFDKEIVQKPTANSTSLLATPAMLAAVIGGAVVGLLCAILLVMYLIYRMRKKDEGSYALDEPAKRPGGYMRAPTNSGKEYYA